LRLVAWTWPEPRIRSALIANLAAPDPRGAKTGISFSINPLARPIHAQARLSIEQARVLDASDGSDGIVNIAGTPPRRAKRKRSASYRVRLHHARDWFTRNPDLALVSAHCRLLPRSSRRGALETTGVQQSTAARCTRAAPGNRRHHPRIRAGQHV